MDSTLTDLTLVNKALYKIGAKTITALDNTDEPNAIIMNDLLPQCREEILEEHPWSFAITTIPLTEIVLLESLPVFGDGVSIAYEIPDDYISLYMVNRQNVQYRMEWIRPPAVASNTYAILSDTPGLFMKYVFLNTDPSTYTAKFYDALACKLALEACFKISEAAQYAAKMEADYTKALMSAMTADSKFSSPDQPIQNEWFAARLAGSGSVSGLPDGNIGFFPDPYNPDV